MTNGQATTMATRILLVEDDPSSQDLIRALCESRGDSVDIAADGFLGLRLLSERRHDIALIDYHLPEMDGYALARLMREIARPEGKVRLVGVTADGHGLASRRGADTLFDAILVKPLEPALLFATLDRLMQPEPAAPPVEVDPADALWRRRGLAGRPKALLCPSLAAPEVEALSQAFRLVTSAEEAQIVLVAGEAGLDTLRGLRAGKTGAFLPSVALEARLGAACDLVFQVGNPDSWTALARACDGFAARAAALTPDMRETPDAARRLLALLAVADRSLTLNTSAAAETPAYETGHSPAARMAAVLSLAEDGKLVCEPSGDGVLVRLTAAGRDSVMAQAVVSPMAASAVDGRHFADGRPAELPAPAPDTLRASTSAGASANLVTSKPSGSTDAALDALPILDLRKVEELQRLVGADQIARLRSRLVETLDVAFRPGSERAALAREAHVMIATAGSLGFDRLAEACRALEGVLATRECGERSLDDVRQAVSEVKSYCEANR